MPEVLHHEPLGVVCAEQRHQNVGGQGHPSATEQDQCHGHRPAPLTAQTQPDPNSHQHNAGVLPNQGNGKSGCPCEPALLALQPQQQQKHAQRQLTEIGEVAEHAGRDHRIGAVERDGDHGRQVGLELPLRQPVQHQPSSGDQHHLQHRKGPFPQQPHQRNPQRQDWGEVLPEPVVTEGGQLTAVDHVGGQLRRECALEGVPPQAVPEHLHQDALVHGGCEGLHAPPLQGAADQQEQCCGQTDASLSRLS